MAEQTLKELVHDYYEAWAAGDRARVRAVLAADLHFRSPQDTFCSADAFLDACWEYSAGLQSVAYVKELYDGDAAFVILRWRLDDGRRFAGAEYLRRRDRLSEIWVVNNDPGLNGLLG